MFGLTKVDRLDRESWLSVLLRMWRTVERVGEEDGGKADGHKDHQVVPAGRNFKRSPWCKRDFAMGSETRC